MKIYFDTEFIEDGHTIDLLSIGLVREDGEEYYAESVEADRSRASLWVEENVLPSLSAISVRPRAQIAREIREFVGPKPEFWAWYADYDWVALCQLYGTMMDLPVGWPMYTAGTSSRSVMSVVLGSPKATPGTTLSVMLDGLLMPCTA